MCGRSIGADDQSRDEGSLPGIRFYRTDAEVEYIRPTLDDSSAEYFYAGHQGDPIEWGRSDFDYIFRCIYDDIASCVWVDEWWETRIGSRPDDVYLLQKAAVVGRLQGRTVRSASVLKDVGPYVFDEWNEIVLYERGDLAIAAFLNIHNHVRFGDQSLFVRTPAARTILYNYDGVFWDIFAKDRGLLNTLTAKHLNDKYLQLFHVDLLLDYASPRQKAEMKPVRE